MDDYIHETIKIYDEVAQEYAHQASTRSPGMQRKLFASLLTKGGKILDLGCGSGRDSLFFHEQGFQVTGVDLSKKLLAIANKNAPDIQFVHEDIRHMSFPESSFDGIWSCASIVHIKHSEQQALFHSLYRILKPGGLLYIHAKNGEGETYIEEPSVPGKKRFYAFFTGSLLEQYCKNAGFSDVEIIDVGITKAYANGKHSKEWIDCFAKKL